MTIDGSLDKQEREKVAKTLDAIGMGELIAYIGAAIEEDDGTFNLHKECKSLIEVLGSEATEMAPLIFRVVTDVVAHDRFVSANEAAYLSGLAKRLNIPMPVAQQLFKQVMAERRARLEIAGRDVDAGIHPNLRELLSFSGSQDLVGQAGEGSIDDLIEKVSEEEQKISTDELLRALTILGLNGKSSLEEAENVWKETINSLDLPRMANLGETFVSAAINRITRINEAYKTILTFHESLKGGFGGNAVKAA